MSNEKNYTYVCFGETLELAESLGWIEPKGTAADESRDDWCDGLEADALDFITNSGFEVIYEEEED